MFVELKDLDADALITLADACEKAARAYRREANSKRKIEQTRLDNQHAFSEAKRAARSVADHVQNGMRLDDALRAASHRHNKPVEQVSALFRRYIINQTVEAREIRRATVVRLAQQQRSNQEIAKALGISSNTVSNDLRAIRTRSITARSSE